MAKIKVNYSINDGAGVTASAELNDGSTLDALVAARMAGKDLNDYIVRVDGQQIDRTTILRHDDLVEFTPKNLKGY